MRGLITKSRAGCIVVISVLFLLLGMNSISVAENRAMEQLLELLEANGSISPQQANKIKSTMAEDLKRLTERERSVREKDKALVQKERSLKEKEDALALRERSLAQKRKTPSTEATPAKETEEVKGEATSGKDTQKDKIVQKGFPLEATFDDGFLLQTRVKDLFSMRIGTLLQADYRYFNYDSDEDPDKNKFDIRRARLILEGHLLNRFSYKFQYEFQGAGSRRLMDAYVDTRILPYLSVRVGQFKTPFGFEQYSADKNIPFAERSMGFLLTPLRDVGLMAHGSFWDRRVNYGVGIFNGDGVDDSVGGDEDSPGLVGRAVFMPFKDLGGPFWDGLQFGGSFSYSKVDRNNVNIKAKTTGLTTFFDVNASAKFNIIREAKSQTRYGAELAWVYGPLLAWGEYINLKFSDVQTSSDEFNINVTDYYGALLWMVTGEKPSIKGGKIQPIKPSRNLWQGGWGALGLAVRYDSFDAGDSAYDYLIQEGISVRKATSYTVALNWYLNPYVRLLIDASRTDFDRPLLIDRDPITGEAIYAEREEVFTGRFQFQF